MESLGRSPGYDCRYPTEDIMNLLTRLNSLPFLLVLAVSICGCSSSNDSRLIGTWKDDEGKGVFTFNSDGGMSGNIKTGSWGILTPTDIRVSGTWRVAGDEIVFTISDSTHAEEALSGMVISEKLVDVDKNSFRTIDENAKSTVYTRVK